MRLPRRTTAGPGVDHDSLLLLTELEKAEGRLSSRGETASALEIALQAVELRFGLFGPTRQSKEALVGVVLGLHEAAAAAEDTAVARVSLERAEAALLLLLRAPLRARGGGATGGDDDAVDAEIVAARVLVFTATASCCSRDGDSAEAVRLLREAVALCGDSEGGGGGCHVGGNAAPTHLYLSRELLAAPGAAPSPEALRHARLAVLHAQDDLLAIATDFEDEPLAGLVPETLFRDDATEDTLYQGGRVDRGDAAQLVHEQAALLAMAYHNLAEALDASASRGEKEAATQWFQLAERLANGCARGGGCSAELTAVLEQIRAARAAKQTPALQRRAEASRASLAALFHSPAQK